VNASRAAFLRFSRFAYISAGRSTSIRTMAAYLLEGLPANVYERVLQLLDASDVAALACVSKANRAQMRTSRQWLVIRFMREPGATNKTALSEVMRWLVEDKCTDALAGPRLVSMDFFLATCVRARLRERGSAP
jgi:hypothetical protein